MDAFHEAHLQATVSCRNFEVASTIVHMVMPILNLIEVIFYLYILICLGDETLQKLSIHEDHVIIKTKIFWSLIGLFGLILLLTIVSFLSDRIVENLIPTTLASIYILSWGVLMAHSIIRLKLASEIFSITDWSYLLHVFYVFYIGCLTVGFLLANWTLCRYLLAFQRLVNAFLNIPGADGENWHFGPGGDELPHPIFDV